MAKFNKSTARPAGSSPISTEAVATGSTYEGHPGYARDVKSELFLLAVSNMVGEQTFYEHASDRDQRYRDLIHAATGEDPEWTASLLRWLRAEGNLRSASLVGAAEFVKARLDADEHGMSREVVDSVLQRADEPGELLAYWTGRYGRVIPKPIKRGISDAAWRLYSERSLLKYDSPGGFRFGDVIELAHVTGTLTGNRAKPIKDTWRGDLYEHALDRRHNRDNPIPESLGMLRARADLMALPVGERRSVLDSPARLAEAGMTWESLAGWLQGPMDADAWTAVIPSMGVMALIRNLRNFDEAGVSDEIADQICARISDPEQVAMSRQLPYRWYSAYREVASDRWRVALGKALGHATGHILALTGRTLILVDTSASMTTTEFAYRSKIRPVDAAALFGVALANRCGPDHVDLFGFASGTFAHPLRRGGSVLREMDRFATRIGEVGCGTETALALKATFTGQDRVVILTDEQSFGLTFDQRMLGWRRHDEVGSQVPANVPIYAFNLGGGYRYGMLPGEPNRHQLGGLTDHTFRLIPLIESGRRGAWPWVS